MTTFMLTTTLLLQLHVPVESTCRSVRNCRLWQVPHSTCSHQVNVQRHAIEISLFAASPFHYCTTYSSWVKRIAETANQKQILHFAVSTYKFCCQSNFRYGFTTANQKSTACRLAKQRMQASTTYIVMAFVEWDSARVMSIKEYIMKWSVL